ncbi:hypothetical protein MSAN_02305400 [Mycena sanguinolenta]|uniref:Uncharacterized protein n=1 Tax=Mycena sanguinolenta TaxID=230812 RepID=A0A8H7CHU5_9AGAR|nr:hypothetical protein MSAN_02305400 [Mycena sanguinolenta]
MGVSLTTKYVSNWQHSCASFFNCTSNGLVNASGDAISCPANITAIRNASQIWGITYGACQAECGQNKIVQSINFSSAVVPLTTWLLPWIALIAQLPFETDGWMDLLSACLCLGSPALATYSLALTAFNRRHIMAKFKRLKEQVQKDTQRRYHYMAQRVDAAAFVLQETQQCPMRADQRSGEFASLIVLPDRQNFWIIAAKDLNNTRRGFTYSFLAQVIFAFLSYLISFLAAIHDSLGSPDVGLQFASSSVWSWMFPVVYGYIRVGSQCKAGAITEALVDNTLLPQRAILSDNEENVTEVRYQKGLRPDADLYPPVAWSDAGGLEGPVPPPTWLGIDVRGDERREGPIFNYARSLTWFAFVEHVSRGFETSINRLKTRGRIPLVGARATPLPITSEGTPAVDDTINPLLTAQDAADCCRLRLSQDLTAFMSLENIPPSAIRHVLFAALVALFLQWGTTGAAIYVAYSTPAAGLGCRSGSYLLYGISATFSWLLLVFSQFVSHALMHRLEQDPHLRSTGNCILARLAVITQVSGKTIAVANAGWLIASSVLEDVGAFQTCWCQSTALSYHTRGWIPLFKKPADLRSQALGTWIGGFTWSIVVCAVTAVIFT